MAGERDSEICIGAFQREHSVSEGPPRGDVHTFRMALWSAHLGGYNPAFEDPSTEECLSYVRGVTGEFWSVYTAEEPQGSEVHLLPYPLHVSETGDINPLDDPWDRFPGELQYNAHVCSYCWYFLDTKASVKGAKSGVLPNKLTT